MADKEEEKSEWNEEILVPLDGLDLGNGKKEDDNYDSGDLVPLDWVDPEEYRKLKEERDRLLQEKEKLETEIKTMRDQNARLAAEKLWLKAEKERIRQEYEEKLRATQAKLSEAEQTLKKQQEQSYQETSRQTTAQQYNVGDKITFGSYPFYEDGREKPIDWIILDIDADNNALVISDYCLDNVIYNEYDITWEKSTIRMWLNSTFINDAFTDEQRSRIIESRIENNDNADYGTSGGNDTYDKLFLLSIEDANWYFDSDKDRIAYPTPYAKSEKSVNENLSVSSSYVSKDRGGSCFWWLRSPGKDHYYAASVDDDGNVESYDTFVFFDDLAVRPAFKINLNNL